MDFLIRLIANAVDIEQWQTIFEGLEQGEYGALFQERMAYFGKDIELKIDNIYDNIEFEEFFVEEWSLEDNTFEVHFEFGGNSIEFVDQFKNLLRSCPCQSIKFSEFQ
ncbi:MAG: hypothetical protein HRU20_20525 [Pseudomonadales bacterium]|nr:hypothetical protein [Pseudomonadales bacterium]